jgi:hypothetical protein
MNVACRKSRGVLKSWDSLFAEAAVFAKTIAPDRLISIAHSQDDLEGVVAVWCWEAGDSSDPAAAARQ